MVNEAIQWAKSVDAELESLRAENELLRESVVDRALDLEDIGWKVIEGYARNDDDTGLDLDNLHKLSEKLREYAASNPWHIRGAQLRHSYVFGRGMNFVDTKPRTDKVLDDTHNKAVLFSVDAYESMNLACFTDAAFIVIRNERTNTFTSIPIAQIQGVVTNPDDAMDIWFIKRVWNSNGKAEQVWIPLSRHKKNTKLPTSIEGEDGSTRIPVAQDKVAYIKHTKRQTGWTWGVPDSFGAYVWTMAYSGYLQDNVKLVHALSKFAWNISRTSAASVDKAAAQVSRPGVGGSVVQADAGSVASVGVPSAQVNMNNGQPLIAAVAASFGVPVIDLLSSPGATGGSYGAATSLAPGITKGFEALQDGWTLFFEEILGDLGSKDAYVEFPSQETDAPYRQITSIATMVELGVVWPDEARDAVLDLLDIPKLHDTLPPKPEGEGTVVSKRGVSADGVVGATSNPGGDTDHDADNE